MAPARHSLTAFAAALACAALAAGCGGAGPTEPATPLPSYLARYPRATPSIVYFLQWQRAGDSVTGTLSFARPAADSVPASTEPVVGEIHERTVSLDVGADAPQRWSGERVGETIVFRVELEGGSVQTLTFVPGTLAAFRRTVARLSAQR